MKIGRQDTAYGGRVGQRQEGDEESLSIGYELRLRISEPVLGEIERHWRRWSNCTNNSVSAGPVLRGQRRICVRRSPAT